MDVAVAQVAMAAEAAEVAVAAEAADVAGLAEEMAEEDSAVLMEAVHVVAASAGRRRTWRRRR